MLIPTFTLPQYCKVYISYVCLCISFSFYRFSHYFHVINPIFFLYFYIYLLSYFISFIVVVLGTRYNNIITIVFISVYTEFYVSTDDFDTVLLLNQTQFNWLDLSLPLGISYEYELCIFDQCDRLTIV